MASFDQELSRWNEKVLAPARAKAAERRERFETLSGIPVQPLYGPANGSEYPSSELGMPGEFPFTRGVQPNMYRGRLWTMRQYAGFGTAEETNGRFRFLLSHGTTGLSTAFDLPTQMGRDSDHPLADGEVGKVGVAIDSLADMETLFDQIPLDQVTTSMTINSTAAVLLALYLAVAEKQGVSWDKVGGTIQNDVLKEYIARGTYIYPPKASMRIVADIFAFCTEKVPKWNTISISGYHMREAGCTAVQEVAFTIANGIAYVEGARARGLDVDSFASRVAFFFNCHNNFFEEVAKFRAARRLWAKVMKERLGAKKDRNMMMRFHTQTAGSSLQAQQPLNNVVRTTVQALAAVCGGTQSLHTNGYDEALTLPTETAATTALRTQQMIAYESGAADTVDPLGGSWYIEQLTDEIQRLAEQYIETIDKMGGSVMAIEKGFQQREIQQAAYTHQQMVESGDRVIVGVNKFQSKETMKVDLLRLNPELEKQQRARLAQVRATRNAADVQRTLAEVTRRAGTSENLMPAIIDAVRVYATLGEISDAMRPAFGEFDAPVFL
jgi:methylmalonyl-CoA mutase N-terminal domain/subunit